MKEEGKMAEKKKLEGKKFTKSRKDRMIDGVCGGLAEYLGVDVNLVRVLWLLSIFLNGFGIIAYIAAMIVVPVNPDHRDLKETEMQKKNPAFYWGIFLVLLGFLFLMRHWDFHHYWRYPWHFRFMPWWDMPWDTLWPLGLIILGIVYILFILRKDKVRKEAKSEHKEEVKAGIKIVRTPGDKVIGGVCGGFARYFGIDTTLLRILLAVVALLTNLLLWIIIYIVLYFVIPLEETDAALVSK